MASDVPSFLVIDFLQLLASCFQCILGLMTIRKWRLNYSTSFLRHYIKMKVVYLIFFGTANAVYVPLVCRDPEFEEVNEYICNYMDIGPAVLIAWFLFEGILLAIIRQISYKNTQDYQRRIILENIYQNPAPTENTDEPKGLAVEFNGIPFSLINSGPLPFKIIETTSLRKKVVQRESKNDLEQIDLRPLIISNSKSISEKVNRKNNDRGFAENSYNPKSRRRFIDIPETKSIKEAFSVNQMEERTKVMNFAPDILTRHK